MPETNPCVAQFDVQIAEVLDGVPLEFDARCTFCLAPVSGSTKLRVVAQVVVVERV